jgi:23S rRNA (uracil1939-C5)-methyltransferase
VIEGRTEDTLSELGEAIDLVVLDPPRGGVGQDTVGQIARLRPERLVYVSCDPATLARDARYLSDFGYELLEVQPLDMFPQTYHIESVALFEPTAE